MPLFKILPFKNTADTASIAQDRYGILEYEIAKNVADFLPNAYAPLTTPTYDTSGQIVHLRVSYTATPWNGYRWWMGNSPYPNGNNQYENPCLLASTDGVTWEVPAGLTNPITDLSAAQIAENGFHSDPHIVMNGNTMEFWYRYYKPSPATLYIRRKTSTDGITWSEEETLFTNSTFYAVSPSVIYENGIYCMWFVDSQDGYKVKYAESADAKVWSSARTLDIELDPLYRFWHLNVIHTDRYEIVVSCTLISSGNEEIFYTSSEDNTKYTKAIKIIPLNTVAGSFDAGKVYMGCLVKVGSIYYCYYSAASVANVWRIGRTRGYSPLYMRGKYNDVDTFITSASDLFVPTDAITVYPSSKITYTKITTAFGASNSFPESTGGVLITDYSSPYSGFIRQYFRIYNSTRTYVRYYNSSNAWTTWEPVEKIITTASDAFTPTDAITAFVTGAITYTKITNAFGLANSFPGSTGGILITDKTIHANGMQRQTYRVYNSDDIYTRYVDNTGAWTAWLKVIQGIEWTAWTPALTWTTADPASITTIARYKTQGKICFFNFMCTSADGNDASQLSISLPAAAKDNNSMISFSSQQLVDATWTNPLAYLDDDSGGITFRNFAVATDTKTVTIIITGQYEIA